MESTMGFTGLTMPVFTAFGWTGEEAAISFALSQLELFINALHANLPHKVREKLPAFGLNNHNQSVYLATSSESDNNISIDFNARPLSLEIQMTISDHDVLNKALKLANSDIVRCHRLISELGPDWSLRIQQMQVDDESGEVGHYSELFKDNIGAFDEETAATTINKAAYLNGEAQWVTPIFISHRIPSEQAAAMGMKIIPVMIKEVENLIPLISFFSGRTTKRNTRLKTKSVEKTAAVEIAPEEKYIDPEDGFTYVTTLKPLHIRRGFVNLTAKHWPFFAVNSRSTTREVTVYYEGVYDKKCTVWRLVPNDQARLVLSPPVHQWLEEYFDSNDKIQIIARKLDEDEIQLSLRTIA